MVYRAPYVAIYTNTNLEFFVFKECFANCKCFFYPTSLSSSHWIGYNKLDKKDKDMLK